MLTDLACKSLISSQAKTSRSIQLDVDSIDLAKVRQEAERKALVEGGKTFEVVGRAWFEHNRERWSKDHAHTIMLRLKKDLYRNIGCVPITQLTRKQLLEELQKIEARKSHEVARRSLQFARNILTYALNEEYMEWA